MDKVINESVTSECLTLGLREKKKVYFNQIPNVNSGRGRLRGALGRLNYKWHK
jgi:hypothetical protein